MMELVEQIISSNLVLTFLTFLVGVLSAFLIRYDYFIIFSKAISVFIVTFLSVSFLFNIGEVYQYSELYKRAFFFFGDGVGGVLVFLIILSLFYEKNVYFYMLVTALAMTVSKSSFILLIIGLSLLYFYSIEYRKKIIFKSIASVPVALVCYLLLAYLSNFQLFVPIVNASVVVESTNVPVVENAKKQVTSLITDFGSYGNLNDAYKKQNYALCEQTLECIKYQTSSSLYDRYFSTLGGLWMTINGGFMGSDVYPNTADKFATLMMSSNPYNLNEDYGLNYADWFRMGQPQNPYVSFSSGYGIIGLISLFLLVSAIVVAALFTLTKLKDFHLITYPVFFITYAVFNQTQLYINPFDGNLFFLGFSAGWVVILVLVTKVFHVSVRQVFSDETVHMKSPIVLILDLNKNK